MQPTGLCRPACGPVPCTLRACVALDLRPAPLDLRPVPLDLRPVPLDLRPVPLDLRPVPLDLRPVPLDLRPVPLDLRPVPLDLRPVPLDLRPVPLPHGLKPYGRCPGVVPPTALAVTASTPGRMRPADFLSCGDR